ncbi:MAG TPA: hypothetical protein VGI64_17830 [Streptosporangiaceae bacterium]
MSTYPVTTNVGTSSVLLYTARGDLRDSFVIFNGGPATVFVGQTGVTASTGTPLRADEQIGPLRATASMFGITKAGTAQVAVSAAAQ